MTVKQVFTICRTIEKFARPFVERLNHLQNGRTLNNMIRFKSEDKSPKNTCILPNKTRLNEVEQISCKTLLFSLHDVSKDSIFFSSPKSKRNMHCNRSYTTLLDITVKRTADQTNTCAAA